MKRKWGITEKVFLILVIAVFAVFGGRKFFSIYNTVKSDETSQSLSTDEAVTVVAGGEEQKAEEGSYQVDIWKYSYEILEAKILKENESAFSGEDIREGLTAIISIKIEEPQFEGQTKQKLGNAEARTAVEGLVTEKLTYFLEQNPQVAKAIVGKAVVAQRARMAARKARDVARRGRFRRWFCKDCQIPCNTGNPSTAW